MNEQQFRKMADDDGFVAALDQSGGSTPQALLAYEIEGDAYSGDVEMLGLIHAMRTRIVTSPSFTSDRILGAILFENTMDREFEGRGSAEYLWGVKGVVPFVKVDKGLVEEVDGVLTMRPMPELDALLRRALEKGIFGTKMRSVIKLANPRGVNAVVDQQFDVALRILAGGLVPIIEPEVDIYSVEKIEAESLLKTAVLQHLGGLRSNQTVMLKLTLPEEDNFYAELVNHPRVLRVLALSGGYSRREANEKLSRNNDVVASFSRGLTEGLTAQQSDEVFDESLDHSIGSIFEASKT